MLLFSVFIKKIFSLNSLISILENTKRLKLKTTYTPNQLSYFLNKISNILKIKNCFTKSIAFFILLRFFSYSPVLMIGVIKNNLNLKSHAWIEISGSKINFEAVEDFEIIKRIS